MTKGDVIALVLVVLVSAAAGGVYLYGLAGPAPELQIMSEWHIAVMYAFGEGFVRDLNMERGVIGAFIRHEKESLRKGNCLAGHCVEVRGCGIHGFAATASTMF